MASVSVLIPVYNGERFVADALDSVLAQSRPADEIVVVDDGSTDGTPAVLDGYARRIRVVRQANRGLSRARNRAAEEAHGEVLAFLDADDAWLPDKLARQLAALEARPECGLATCGQVQTDEALKPLADQPFEPDGDLVARMLAFDTSVIVGGSTMAVRRAVFDELRGFDPVLSTSADWDFFGRAAAAHAIHIIRQPLVLYRLHSGGMHRNVRLMEHDMTIAMGKLLAQLPSSRRASLRATAYADLYAILAASYAAAGSYGDAARCLARGLRHHPLPPLRRALKRLAGRRPVRAAG